MRASWVIYDCNWWDADGFYAHYTPETKITYPVGLKCNESVWMIPDTFVSDD